MKQFPFGVLGLVVAALLFGAAASWLFHEEPIGINFSVWVLAVLCVGVYARRPATATGYVPLAGAILFAILFAWREGEPVKQFLVLTILISCFLTAIAAHGRSLRIAYAHEYIVDGIQLGLSIFTVPGLVLRGLHQEMTAVGKPRAAAAFSTLLGVIIAIPALVIFGSLFSEADPTFKKWFVDTLYFDFENAAQYVFQTLVFGCFAIIAWVLYLEGTPRTRTPREQNPQPIGWGSIEINVALGLISVLFLCFVAIQLPYFFGGHERVQTEEHLTYAEYARQGFFELTAVSALTFALLLGSATIIQGTTGKARTAYKIVSGILIACVGIIMASAMHRLSLYIDTYGVTSNRLYAGWFMAWLAVAFVWLYVTIFRDRLRTFAWGFLLSGYAAILVVTVINPDGLAVKITAARAIEREIDADKSDKWWVGMLNIESIPAFVDALPKLIEPDRKELTEELAKQEKDLVERPNRTWTLSLQNARDALERLRDPASR